MIPNWDCLSWGKMITETSHDTDKAPRQYPATISTNRFVQSTTTRRATDTLGKGNKVLWNLKQRLKVIFSHAMKNGLQNL